MTKAPQYQEAPPWESIARDKKASRDARIPLGWKLKPDQVPDDQLNVTNVPYECGILTPKELKITNSSARTLIERILSREYISYEVTLAFCKRAAIAQQLVNCLSEIFFENALEAAKSLDAEYEESGIARGPLHGLPVSLKDCFQVEGTDAAIGYTALVNQPTSKEDESEITKIMRQSGAILFCKTNVPTALMSGETFNAIYGYTSNPYNRNLSSGGSSGGESALLALRGSPLGIGTDVGGSVRIPASFCGLYSLKPSFGRFPTSGIRDGLNGQEAVRNTVGPMAHSLEDIEMWCKTVIDSQPHLHADPDCLPIPWRQPDIPKKLCFGLLLDDGIVKPLPPVTRALLRAKTALEVAGHAVIEFSIDEPLFLDSLKFDLYRSAAADSLQEVLERTGEPWPQGYEILGDMANDENYPKATVSDLWKAQAKRTAYSKQILQKWAATKDSTKTEREIDALIMPCSPWPASSRHEFIYDNYTSLWNVLDYCATTVPVTHKLTNADTPEDMAACPVAIQVVGQRLHEEYLLGATRSLQLCLEISDTK
ncbi:unnamed protein product [Penicillium pancosmium]